MKTAPQFFASPAEFRAWLKKHHATERELLVGYYKVDTGKPSMTWSQSVDQAICFGWIDGVRRSIDRQSYCIRFTPRNPSSNWSAVNMRKVAELTRQGLMQPAGIAVFKNRRGARSQIYGYESRPQAFPRYEKLFRAMKPAWDFFSEQAPSYRRTIMHWVISAKRVETQLARLRKTIESSARKKRLF